MPIIIIINPDVFSETDFAPSSVTELEPSTSNELPSTPYTPSASLSTPSTSN